MAGALDVDSRLLGRPPTFSGDEAGWEDWAFTMRAYLCTLQPHSGVGVWDAELWLTTAETSAVFVDNARMLQDGREFSQHLYYILAMLLKGGTLITLKRVPRGHGLEAWRQLCIRYDRPAAGRVHALLGEIMRPKSFPQESGKFEEALTAWEQKIDKWETLAQDILNDAIKRQILIEQAPAGIRVHLTLQGHRTYADM